MASVGSDGSPEGGTAGASRCMGMEAESQCPGLVSQEQSLPLGRRCGEHAGGGDALPLWWGTSRQAKKRRAKSADACDNVFCAEWAEGIVAGIRKAPWGHGGQTHAGSQHVGTTLTKLA